MRRAAKVDDNQAAIVADLRRVGVSVVPLHSVGGGVPDLLCGYRGRNYLIEIKDGEKVKSAKKLNALQNEWHETWRGQVGVAECTDDALRLVGLRMG